jgi:hypothetical protein
VVTTVGGDTQVAVKGTLPARPLREQRMTRVRNGFRQSLPAGAWHLMLASIMIAPGTFFTLTGLAHPNYVQMWQGAGLLAAVMGIGYAIAARNPLRYWPVILIGLIPKIISPIGVVWDFWQRELPTALSTLVP